MSIGVSPAQIAEGKRNGGVEGANVASWQIEMRGELLTDDEKGVRWQRTEKARGYQCAVLFGLVVECNVDGLPRKGTPMNRCVRKERAREGRRRRENNRGREFNHVVDGNSTSPI